MKGVPLAVGRQVLCLVCRQGGVNGTSLLSEGECADWPDMMVATTQTESAKAMQEVWMAGEQLGKPQWRDFILQPAEASDLCVYAAPGDK